MKLFTFLQIIYISTEHLYVTGAFCMLKRNKKIACKMNALPLICKAQEVSAFKIRYKAQTTIATYSGNTLQTEHMQQ